MPPRTVRAETPRHEGRSCYVHRVNKLRWVFAGSALLLVACGLTLSTEPDDGPLDASPAPSGTTTATTRPPLRDATPPVEPDATLVLDAASGDAEDGAADASDAGDASDARPDASDAGDASDARPDASDGGPVIVPPATFVFRFSGLVGGRFVNDANATLPGVPTNAAAQSDAPLGFPGPATNPGSVRIAPNTRGWVKVDAAQAAVTASPVTKLTLSAWVKPEVTAGTATVVSFSTVRGATPLFEIARSNTNGVRFGMGELVTAAGSTHVGSTTPFLAPGAWRFLAVTYDGATGQACFYRGAQGPLGEATLDGCVAYAGRSFTPSPNRDSALVIGNSANENVADPTNPNRYVPSFGGGLDAVRITLGSTLNLSQIRAVQALD